MPPLFLILPILFAGAIFSTIAGGGLGILLTLAATFFIDIRTSIILVSLLGFIIQLAKLAHFHTYVRWDMVSWYLLAGIPASFSGAFLLFILPERVLEVSLAALCLVYVVMHMFHLMPRLKPTRTTLMTVGAMNGAVGGILGHGALLRLPALLSFGLTKEQFVGTSAFLAFFMNAGKASVYVWRFPWSEEAVILFLAAIPTVFIGTWCGRLLLRYVSEDHFEKLLLCVIVFGAIRLLFFP
ncbi:MAG: sulfite exporter TauE/SafE family protein [Patescibacteria group bacterium]